MRFQTHGRKKGDIEALADARRALNTTYIYFIFLYSRFHRRWWKIRSLQTIHNCDVHTLSILLHDSLFDWNPITFQLWIHQFNCFDIGLFHYISRWLKTKYQISLFWFLVLVAIQNQKMLVLQLFVTLMSCVPVWLEIVYNSVFS